jgi:hypothetical protein
MHSCLPSKEANIKTTVKYYSLISVLGKFGQSQKRKKQKVLFRTGG